MSGLRSSLLVLTIAVSFAYLFSEQLSSYIPENIQDQWKSLVSNHIQNFFKDEKEKSTKNDEEVLNQNNRNKENQEEIDKNQSNVKPGTGTLFTFNCLSCILLSVWKTETFTCPMFMRLMLNFCFSFCNIITFFCVIGKT